MLQFDRMRYSYAAAAIVLALVNAPASAIESGSPTRMVRDIYALYGKDGSGFNLRGPEASAVLSPSLLALVSSDAARAQGEVGALDFDPFCACQDFDITNVTTSLIAMRSGRTEIRVNFKNFGKPQSMRLILLKTRQGWRVRDIASREVPSIVRYLQKSLWQ